MWVSIAVLVYIHRKGILPCLLHTQDLYGVPLSGDCCNYVRILFVVFLKLQNQNESWKLGAHVLRQIHREKTWNYKLLDHGPVIDNCAAVDMYVFIPTWPSSYHTSFTFYYYYYGTTVHNEIFVVKYIVWNSRCVWFSWVKLPTNICLPQKRFLRLRYTVRNSLYGEWEKLCGEREYNLYGMAMQMLGTHLLNSLGKVGESFVWSDIDGVC